MTNVIGEGLKRY